MARAVRSGHIRTVAALFALAGLLGCGDSERRAWCQPGDPDGEVAFNTGESVWERAGASPRLVELWRVGGLNEGQALAYPVGIAASRTGRIAIPDFQLGEVILVEPDGRWRGSVVRKGRGPGEILAPVAAAWGAAGELAVFDITAPKVVVFGAGDSLLREVPVDPAFTSPIVASGQLSWAGVTPDGSVLIQLPPRLMADPNEAGNATVLILRLPPDAVAPDTVVQDTGMAIPEGDFAGWLVPGWPRPLAAIGVGGRFAVAGKVPVYRIRIHDPRGREVRWVCRDAPLLPLSDEERGNSSNPEMEALAAAVREAPRPPVPASFGRIFLGARGRLWVQRDRPGPDPAASFHGVPGALYDVFAPDGRYLGEVRAPPNARLGAAAGDTVWGFEFGELDETWVVAYRLELE